MLSRRVASTIVLATMLLFGCGKKDTEQQVSDTAGGSSEETAPAATAEVQAAAGNPVAAPLTPADIERWDRGMAGEMKAIQEAGAKIKSVRTGEDTLSAIMGVQEMATISAAAQAAGLDQERYKFVRSNLSAVVSYLAPSQGGIDTTLLSPAQRDELRQMNEARIQQMQEDVPPEVVEALKPRAVELRKKDLELVGARLKGAGMTQ